MTASSLVAGTRLGPYEILSLLGEGGMGEVYRARDHRLSREVAIKVLHREVSSDPDSVRRFEQEARAAGGINHPNIVAVYDTGLHEGAPYIVSELLQGETLRARLERGVPGARKSVEYGVQICRGLAAAHEKSIVHRDLKPENVFLTKDGMVKILDFGIAKLGPSVGDPTGTEVETRSRTEAGTVMGTAGYMSPEQVRGLATDHRSDFFAFGAVLFEMITGTRGFRGATPADTMSAILREDPTDPSRIGAEWPAGLLRVVRRCLEKSPEDRFQTARDLGFALEGSTTETTGSSGRTSAEPLAFRGWKAGVALAILAGGGLVGAWCARGLLSAPPPTSFRRLTFRVGRVIAAQFAPDGESIVYSARWGKNPI
ncbi:MAG: serine/threonine-protein kinase, partial [Vicinamibacteria bacterium]